MQINCLKLASIALVFLLVHCSLVGEPTYRRFAPEIALIAEEDGAVVDVPDPIDQVEFDGGAPDVPDPIVDADVPTDNPFTPIYPGRCVQNTVEICNGIDDNCNGDVDEGPANPAVTCLTGSGAMGTRGANCDCLRTRMTTEICFNGLDDDGDPSTLDLCPCSVLLSADSAPLGGRAVVTTWANALAAVTNLPDANKVICLVTPPVMGGAACNTTWIFPDNITLPPNVQLIGSFVRSAGGPVREPNCRPTLSGTVVFAPNATLNTSLSAVRVRPSVTDRTMTIDMQGAGSLSDVIVVRDGSTAAETIGVGSSVVTNAPRWLRNVSVAMGALSLDGVGVSFRGGQLFTDRLIIGVQSAGARGQVRGIRLTEMSFVQLKDTGIETLRGGIRAVGIDVVDPSGPTNSFRYHSLSPATTSANGGFVSGLSAVCTRGAQPVTVDETIWAGGSTSAGTAVGLRSDRCDLTLRNPIAVGEPPLLFVGAGGMLASLAETAAAVVCMGPSACAISSMTLFPVSPLARPGAVLNASGIAASDQTRVTLSDVRIAVGISANDGVGSLVENSSVGVDVDRSSMFAERSVIWAGTTRTRMQQPIGVRWNGGPSLVLRESVVVVEDGIGAQIPANLIVPESAGIALVSNTFLRPSNQVPFRSIAQLSITGALRVGAQFRVVNNIFSPLVANDPIGPSSSAAAIRSEMAQVFSEFTHNLVGFAAQAAQIGAMSYMTAAQARVAFGVAGSFMGPTDIQFGANDFHILPASPARGTGYLPAVAGRKDIDGEVRPRPVMGADIGADEID